MRGQTHKQTHKQTDKQTQHTYNTQTHRQTDICLQKIYVEGPVQNNEKTKIENVVWIKMTGPLQDTRLYLIVITCRGNKRSVLQGRVETDYSVLKKIHTVLSTQ